MAMAKAAVAVIVVAGLVEARVAISGAVMVGLFFTAMHWRDHSNCGHFPVRDRYAKLR